ncbi:hypothetical protein F4703DRAFT_1793490 [Phycomyces blakesleeanus]
MVIDIILRFTIIVVMDTVVAVVMLTVISVVMDTVVVVVMVINTSLLRFIGNIIETIIIILIIPILILRFILILNMVPITTIITCVDVKTYNGQNSQLESIVHLNIKMNKLWVNIELRILNKNGMPLRVNLIIVFFKRIFRIKTYRKIKKMGGLVKLYRGKRQKENKIRWDNHKFGDNLLN